MVTIDAIRSKLDACKKLNQNLAVLNEDLCKEMTVCINACEQNVKLLEASQKSMQDKGLDLKTISDKMNATLIALMDIVVKLENNLQEKVKEAEEELKSEQETEELQKEIAILQEKGKNGTATEADSKRMGEIFQKVIAKFNSLKEEDLGTPFEMALLPMMKGVLNDVGSIAESNGVFNSDKSKIKGKP